ncbi:MAG TPA: hypothetical protein ENK05_06515 [Gammaproteobacteria bacterium]|nr:hypothetical protein [Gammaproteobacteria bacterium]
MSARNPHPPPDGEATSADTLMFLGPWVESTPMFFLTDPALDPNERSVFGALWAWLKRQGRQDDRMPDIADIQRLANIRSRERVVQSITVLRLTRWITLHTRVRDAKGRHRTNVQALNPEPLSLAETLAVDASYMQFLAESATHRREKIRNLARKVLDGLTQIIDAGRDPLQPPTLAEQIESRQEAGGLIDGSCQSTDVFGVIPVRVSLIDSDVPVDKSAEIAEQHPSTFNRLGSAEENIRVRLIDSDEPVDKSPENPENIRVRLIDSDAKPVLRPTICSSSSNNKNNKNTTTTPPIPPPSSYAWPEFWDDNVKALLMLTLKTLPEGERQDWIDELAGQYRARRKTHDPIRRPVVYFQAICKRYLAGEAQLTDYAIAERERRLKQARLAAAQAAPPAPTAPARAPASDKAAAQAHLRSMTQALKGRAGS